MATEPTTLNDHERTANDNACAVCGEVHMTDLDCFEVPDDWEGEIDDDPEIMTDGGRDLPAEGDRVRVEIESPASPFGGTQTAEFDVTEVHDDKVFGVDPAWGDDVEVIGLDGGTPHYADAGKSGDVVELAVMETDDGVTVHGSETTLYAEGSA